MLSVFVHLNDDNDDDNDSDDSDDDDNVAGGDE